MVAVAPTVLLHVPPLVASDSSEVPPIQMLVLPVMAGTVLKVTTLLTTQRPPRE